MVNIKKLLCLLAALLLLAGCSTAPQPVETEQASTAPDETLSSSTTATEPEPEPPGPGLYELCSYTAAGGYRPTTMVAQGNEAVVLLWSIASEQERQSVYMQVLDLDAGSAGPICLLEGAEELDAYLLSIEDDGSLVYYNPYSETAAHYDRQGKLLGQIENPYQAVDDWQFPHALTNQRFSFQKSAAWYHSYAEGSYLWSAYALADEPEALYLLDGGYDYVCDAKGKRLLEASHLPGNGGLRYRILDLDGGQELDRVSIENDAVGADRESTFLNEGEALLCDAGAVMHIARDRFEPGEEYGEGGPEPDWEERIYLWRLDDAAAQRVELRRVTEDTLRAENDEIVARVGERYEINVLLDVAPEGDRPPLMENDYPEEYKDATLITGIDAFSAYDLLRHLERFLELLPEGFTHEMQTDYPPQRTEASLAGFDGFDIYIIKEIPGGAGAYANGWEERMKIVLATDEFSASTLPHEFMHLIDRRVAAYYDSIGESFWDAWTALTPADFDYFAEKKEYALVNDSFVSYYAMTNPEEDKAETFMYMFTAQESLEELYWYKDAPCVQAKVAFLTEAIRSSFPSVQAVEKAYWEHDLRR